MAPHAVVAYLEPSSRAGHKYQVTLTRGSGAKTVHFGARGYADYTTHRDPARMRRYLARHHAREDWTRAGIETPGFWARWLLWSEPSLSAAARRVEACFGLRLVCGPPPRGVVTPTRPPRRSTRRRARRRSAGQPR